MMELLRDAGLVERCTAIEALALSPRIAATLRRAVATAMAPATPAWDDAAALSALGGEAGAVQALRRLFLKELPVQSAAVASAWSGRDDAGLREQLHRLKASCAFVGATALLEAVRALHEQPGDAGAHARFQARAAAMLDEAAA